MSWIDVYFVMITQLVKFYECVVHIRICVQFENIKIEMAAVLKWCIPNLCSFFFFNFQTVCFSGNKLRHGRNSFLRQKIFLLRAICPELKPGASQQLPRKYQKNKVELLSSWLLGPCVSSWKKKKSITNKKRYEIIKFLIKMNSVHILSSVSTEDDAFIIQKLWKKKFIFKIVMPAMDFEQLIFQIQYSLYYTRLEILLIKPCLKFLNKLQSFILCSCSIWKKVFFPAKNAVVHFWSCFISLFLWNSQHTQEFFPIISKAILLFGMLSEHSSKLLLLKWVLLQFSCIWGFLFLRDPDSYSYSLSATFDHFSFGGAVLPLFLLSFSLWPRYLEK